MSKDTPIKIDLSEGWYEILVEGIRLNTEYIEGYGISDKDSRKLLYRNECVLRKIEEHIKDNGIIRLYPSEMRAVFWILMENMHNLQMEVDVAKDYCEEVRDILDKSNKLIDEIMEEYGIEIDD